MDPSTLISYDHSEQLLNAQTHIWTHIFSSLNSMALKCAIQLQIPDTIHNHGKPMTLGELANALILHPTKSASLYRITRLLVHSNFLSKSKLVNGEDTFDLTINAKLLLKDHPMSLAPFALAMLDPTLTKPAHHLSSWFRNDDVSPFHTVHGSGIWEYAEIKGAVVHFTEYTHKIHFTFSLLSKCSPSVASEFFRIRFYIVFLPLLRFYSNKYFNKAMTSDAKFVGDILMGDVVFKGLLKGVESLVDVAGGTGKEDLKNNVSELAHIEK
ncbi:trans-resveratrol di-O-methyltransferase-like [Silene latifolia]|uniref:trans-resveratrol di-O-methyltransferase-like n=1 Tax=Silene latifolia TaxID=37657 RepID=UPI003D773EF2